MDPDNDTSPPFMPTSYMQPSQSGRRSLPPVLGNALGPPHALSTYPSSAMHQYYRSIASPILNYAHISTHAPNFPLPSVSQSHLPSIRHTPSTASFSQAQSVIQNVMPTHGPSPNQNFHPNIPNTLPENNSRPPYQNPVSPLPQIFAPRPIPLPINQIPPIASPVTTTSSLPSYSRLTLPTTKDIPLLTGRHDWGPWHSAVRTLILHLNLLGHIADSPLPERYMTRDYGRHIHLQSTSNRQLSNSHNSRSGGPKMV